MAFVGDEVTHGEEVFKVIKVFRVLKVFKVFKEGGSANRAVPAVDSHRQRLTHFADGAHALEGLGLSLACELQELVLKRSVVEHRLAEDGIEACRLNEGRKDDVGEKALGTVSAPNVLLAAHVARTEHIVVGREAAEEHGYLKLGEGAQEREIVEAGAVGTEVVLELEAFAVLVVDRGAEDSAFVGRTLVAEGHIGDAAEDRSQMRVEGQHGAEGRVPVEVTFGVEVEERGVYGATDDEHLADGKAGLGGAFHRGTARIHDERTHSATGTAQELEGDDAVLAATDWDKVFIRVLNNMESVGFAACMLTVNLHIIVKGRSDAVGVEKLTEAMPVELAPEGYLCVGETAAEHLDRWRTGALPITHQLNHADIEDYGINVIAEIEERTPLDDGRWVELYVAHAEVEPQAQTVGFLTVVVGLILEDGILPPQRLKLLVVVVHVIFNDKKIELLHWHNKKRAAALKETMKKTAILTMLLGLAVAAAGQGMLDKGLAAEAKGLGDLAEGYYREAADTSATARLRLGMLLQRREHYADAREWLIKADSSAVAMAHLAECHVETKDWAAAKLAAEKAIETADKDDKETMVSAMSTLALVYCNQENYTNALNWAHKAIKADPTSARAQNATGVIYFRKGNDIEALKAFREALKHDPNNVDAHFNIGTIYCYHNNHDNAITTLRKGLKENRKSVKLYYCLGWAFMLKGDKPKAIECLQTVIELDTGYVNAYYRLGDIYFGNGEFNKAIEQYRKAIAIAPRMTEGYRLLGRTYAEMGDFGKAIRNYQKAVEIDNKDSETYCNIAELYGRQKHVAKERNNYRRAAKLGNAKAQEWCTKNGITY